MSESNELQQFQALDSLLEKDEEARWARLYKRKDKKAPSTSVAPPSGHFKDLDSYMTQHATVSEIQAKSGHVELPVEDTLLSRFAADIATIVGSLLLFAVLSLLLMRGDVPISGTRVTLGERGYYGSGVSAPALSGSALDMVSRFLSTSRTGPW